MFRVSVELEHGQQTNTNGLLFCKLKGSGLTNEFQVNTNETLQGGHYYDIVVKDDRYFEQITYMELKYQRQSKLDSQVIYLNRVNFKPQGENKYRGFCSHRNQSMTSGQWYKLSNYC